jgi:hypothetical protein
MGSTNKEPVPQGDGALRGPHANPVKRDPALANRRATDFDSERRVENNGRENTGSDDTGSDDTGSDDETYEAGEVWEAEERTAKTHSSLDGPQFKTEPVPAWASEGTGTHAGPPDKGSLGASALANVTTHAQLRGVHRLSSDTAKTELPPPKTFAPDTAKTELPPPETFAPDTTKTELPPVEAFLPRDAHAPALTSGGGQSLAVASEAEMRRVDTRPVSRGQRGELSRGVKLGLTSVATLCFVLMVWVFGRQDTVKDPSLPSPLKPFPKKVASKAPVVEKKVDVSDVVAAPKAALKPALSMQLVVDAGFGSTETKTVSASIVRIETEPLTEVFWSGQSFGWTPALITMPVGLNALTFENKNLGLRRTMTVSANDEERTFLRFEFAKGWLSIDRPASAKVTIDGAKVLGRTIGLWEGRHRVDVVFANGAKATKLADVVRGETAEVFFDEPILVE